MTRLIVIALLAFVAWKGYAHYQSSLAASPAAPRAVAAEVPATSPFKCDGRTHCSQMTSCAEATFFLRNCPGVKMDGNHDGVPCEQQWCK